MRSFRQWPLLCLLLVTTISFGAQVTVTNVRAYATKQKVRVVLDLNTNSPYRDFTLSNPNRVVIDMGNATLKSGVKLPTFQSVPWMTTLRSGTQKGKDLRFVIDTTVPCSINSFALAGSKPRLVFDIFPKVRASASKSGTTVTKVAPKKVTLRDVRIEIDPGHGGKDPGGIGKGGTKEKVVVLKIAKYLREYIRKEPGMKAYMTRDGDYFVSLRGRLNIARKDSADVFIAIHADIFKNSAARGATVFALSKRGATSEAARWLAQRENTSDLVGGVDLTDKSRVLRSVLIDLSQTATINSSLKLGGDVLRNLNLVSKLLRPHVEQAGFVVLKSPDIPSILVETGFLSNPYEERNLRQSWYQKKIAYAIFKGLKKYLYTYPPQDSKIMAWVRANAKTYIVHSGDSLSKIAARYHTTVTRLKSINNLKSDKVYVGQKLKV